MSDGVNQELAMALGSYRFVSNKRKSTIEHGTEYLNDTDTQGFLRVGGLNKHSNHAADKKRKRAPRDKVKHFAVKRFGYKPDYLRSSVD